MACMQRSGHRSSGPGYLRPGAAEDCGEETDGDCTVYSGDGAETGSDTKSECDGQANDGRGQSAENVALQRFQVVSESERIDYFLQYSSSYFGTARRKT